MFNSVEIYLDFAETLIDTAGFLKYITRIVKF
jgi:hypothetical protein